MLIHHFGAETHGFQGLVDQNGPKRLSLRKITFSETNIFLRGFRGREPVRTKATSSPMQILHETFYDFDVPRCKTIKGLSSVHILRNTGWGGGVFPIYYNIT